MVSPTDLYGSTWNLFANTFKTFGIEVHFVDPSDPENFRRATHARTRAYFAETLPSPKRTMISIAAVAAIGEQLGATPIVDDTTAPVICKPFKQGAHIVRLFAHQVHRWAA